MYRVAPSPGNRVVPGRHRAGRERRRHQRGGAPGSPAPSASSCVEVPAPIGFRRQGGAGPLPVTDRRRHRAPRPDRPRGRTADRALRACGSASGRRAPASPAGDRTPSARYSIATSRGGSGSPRSAGEAAAIELAVVPRSRRPAPPGSARGRGANTCSERRAVPGTIPGPETISGTRIDGLERRHLVPESALAEHVAPIGRDDHHRVVTQALCVSSVLDAASQRARRPA